MVVFTCMLGSQGKPALLPVISTVVEGSAAAQVGLQVGDRIKVADGEPVATFEQLRPILQRSSGQVVELRVQRGDNTLSLRPRLGTIQMEGRPVGYLGVHVTERTHSRLGVAATAAEAARMTWSAITETVHGIARAITTGQGTENFAGIVGITQLAGQAAAAGGSSILTLIAILSANLALMNLLPIPVLDGGAFLFCLAEWVRGRPASPRVEALATRTGAATVAAMFMLSTLHDLAGLIGRL